MELFWRIQCSIVWKRIKWYLKTKYFRKSEVFLFSSFNNCIISGRNPYIIVSMDFTHSSQLLNCIHVALIFFHFLSISHNLFNFLWVDIFWPSTFRVINTSGISFEPLRIDLFECYKNLIEINFLFRGWVISITRFLS